MVYGSQSVAICDHETEIARYVRCWRRGQILGADLYQQELLEQRPAAERSAAQRRLVLLLGDTGESYLRNLAETDRSLTRQIKELLILVRQYGPEAVMAAVRKTQSLGAIGADYIERLWINPLPDTPRARIERTRRSKDTELSPASIFATRDWLDFNSLAASDCVILRRSLRARKLSESLSLIST